MPNSLHSVRFPNESPAYRTARNKLLAAEVALRKQIETVAVQRRKLPLGGKVPEDYVFERSSDGSADGESESARMSELFEGDKNTLLVYSYMFGPEMKESCNACTSILDALDGAAPHVMQRVNFAVVAKSPLKRILRFTNARGWHNYRSFHQPGIRTTGTIRARTQITIRRLH